MVKEQVFIEYVNPDKLFEDGEPIVYIYDKNTYGLMNICSIKYADSIYDIIGVVLPEQNITRKEDEYENDLERESDSEDD